MLLATVVDLCGHPHRAEVHDGHAARRPQDLARSLEVLAGLLPQGFGLDEIRHRRHG